MNKYGKSNVANNKSHIVDLATEIAVQTMNESDVREGEEGGG